MEDYMAYLLGPDGLIAARIDLVCADESAAKDRAQELAGEHAVELWQGSRKIAEYPAQ